MDTLPVEVSGPGVRIGIHGAIGIAHSRRDRRRSARRYGRYMRLIARVVLVLEIRTPRRHPSYGPKLVTA